MPPYGCPKRAPCHPAKGTSKSPTKSGAVGVRIIQHPRVFRYMCTYLIIFGYCLDTLLNISGECSKSFGPLSSRLHMDPNLSNWKQEIQTPLLGFHVAIRLESFPPEETMTW